MTDYPAIPTFQPAEDWDRPFHLPHDEIHLWRVRLDVSEDWRRRCEAVLAEDERRRAQRFVFDRDQRRFIVCRGALRSILAGYLGRTPQAVAFCYGPHGKPRLEGAGDPPLHFNVSHSGDLALVGLRRGGELGVDLERLRSVEEAQAIARRYFTPREFAAIEAYAPPERIAAFFRCWTRKEALLKAVGIGIGFPLNEVEVDVEADVPPLVRFLGPSQDSLNGKWRLHHLEPDEGYVGAAAAQGQAERLVGWRWSGEGGRRA